MNKRKFLFSAAALAASVAAPLRAAGTDTRTAFVYLSRTGNTRSVGEAVRALAGCDLYAVETVEPYPDDYSSTTRVVQAEQRAGTHRAIKPVAIDLSRYDTVILGTPTWWGRAADPLLTWIKSADLSGKRILTVNTHGGSGQAQTRADIEAALAGRQNLRLMRHLTVRGAVSPDDAEVARWLREGGVMK